MPTHRQMANALRLLAVDAVEKANSGHPGMPMGMADIAEVLWNDFLKFNPNNPNWFNRDRFILSNGHGSMLLYALLHLTGYDISIEDLKQFRQLHSKTPGHPEYAETPGVETTTGPLGQGFANAVGMAIAETQLAATFNQVDANIIDHFTYVFLGDGCLMEGISHEAASLAGTLKLGKLIAFWDNNGISIDGEVKTWFTDNTAMRFKSYGWQVIENIDGHDPEAITRAIQAAQQNTEQPTLIDCHTSIGFGSPNLAGTATAHGAPLGKEEITKVRKALDWPYPAFEIPDDLQQAWCALDKGSTLEKKWQQQYSQYQKKYPEQAQILEQCIAGELPENWQALIDNCLTNMKQAKATLATRKTSNQVLNQIAPQLPALFGGSADLSGSNGTLWKDAEAFTATHHAGRYLHYGVREFGMSAIMNGIMLHKGLHPYAGTFLTFLDYARNAVRMAALMRIPTIFVYTHDSVGIGEDGPTHQPVEHLNMLRITPNVHSWRPCDGEETVIAWKQALERKSGPTCLILTRQSLPFLDKKSTVDAIEKGGYILWEPDTKPQVILIATGSEVHLAQQAALQLAQANIACRVVSMPCPDLFLEMPSEYQLKVLPANIHHRIAIEAGTTNYWHTFVGTEGKVIGVDSFGLSAPAKQCFAAFNLTVENIIKQTKNLLA